MGSAPSSDIPQFNPQWLLEHSWYEIVHGGQEQFNTYGARIMRELDCDQMAYTFRWNTQRGIIEFQQDCISAGTSIRQKMGLMEVPDMKRPGFLVFYGITDYQCILTWRVLDYHPNWLVIENQNSDIQIYWSSPTIDVCSYNSLMERTRTLGLPINRFVVNKGVISQSPDPNTTASACATVAPAPCPIAAMPCAAAPTYSTRATAPVYGTAPGALTYATPNYNPSYGTVAPGYTTPGYIPSSYGTTVVHSTTYPQNINTVPY